MRLLTDLGGLARLGCLLAGLSLLTTGCIDFGDRSLDPGGDGGVDVPSDGPRSDARADSGPPPDAATRDAPVGNDVAAEAPSGGPSFAADVQPIFNANCAVLNCHITGSFNVLGLFLEQAVSYQNLVNVPSVQRTSEIRVVPGDAERSYLYAKITATPGDPRIAGMPMPLQRPPLSPADVATIRDWINAGALNN